MINPQYYSDIKQFPNQFKEGFKLAKELKVSGTFNRVVVCGMGGSSLYVEMINDFLHSLNVNLRLEAARSYHLPSGVNHQTLFIVASYSGTTEETLSCLEEIQKNNFNYCVFASGGFLLERAGKAPKLIIPKGRQLRLSTGYFIAGVLKLLNNCGLIQNLEPDILLISKEMESSMLDSRARILAHSLVNHVPIIYSTDNNSSIARVSKIKFNENSKVQAFHNFFPELNHNEMVGFTNLLMKPFFLIFQSKFTSKQNHKRIETFMKIMRDKKIPVEIVEMIGSSVIAEILNAYYFIDHVTYYLAEEYGIDPEPVEMVEEFKRLLDQ